MRPLQIGIAGAGPAGLYAALLLKKANPGSRIQVVERNPAGATYGFGVVLSDRTLTSFREADAPTFDAITAHQATWEAIETHIHGEVVRCGGHSYLGIGRKRLLDILQQRCEELGVELCFQTDLTDLSAFAGCDLIIGADGVGSSVRSLLAEYFRPSLTAGRSRYIWLGVQWVPRAFTFAFEETRHGLFQAHMYPYDEHASTCILMCSEDTWRQAGLDRATEGASLAFCQELLAPYTGGARVMSNRSLWYTFQTVRNARWSHGSVVLLGDAAHTAHWSIGSGTKLAMEDAISLVRALSEAGTVPEALVRYEAERRPAVERLQQAGQISERYCEEAEKRLGLAPVQFAFQLMTRSGRMDYESLRERDPGFIEAVERWFAGQAGVEPVLVPLTLRGVTLPTRIVRQGRDGLFFPDNPSGGQPTALWLERPPSRGTAEIAALRGIDLLGLTHASPEECAAVRAAWREDRPLAVTLPPLGPDETAALARALVRHGCDLIALDSDDPCLGELVRRESAAAVLLRAASRTAANTLVAGARADLCLLRDPD